MLKPAGSEPEGDRRGRGLLTSGPPRSGIGCGGWLVLILISSAILFAISKCSSDAPRVAAPDPVPAATVEEQMQAMMTPGPVTRSEMRALTALLREATGAAGTNAEVWTFYVTGDPTMCGSVGSVRVGLDRRFMAKNGRVLLEGDVTQSVFEDFWRVCMAGNRLPER